MFRVFVLLLLLGGLAWWLHGEQTRGRFRQADSAFLEILLANSRDRFVPDASKNNKVVFLPLRQSESTEFAAWPPEPLDYQMILKGAMQFTPSVIVMVDPLHWPAPKPAMIDELAQTLLPLPAVVMTATAAKDGTEVVADSETLLLERLGSLALQRGESVSLLSAENALIIPEPALLRVADPSLLPLNEAEAGVPMLGVRAGRIHPAPALLGAFRVLNIPVSSASVALGGGAGVLSDTGFYLPLAEDGTLVPASAISPKEQNALELMTVAMVDDPDQGIAERMGENRVLVIGKDGPDNGAARKQAHALAHALALPQVQMLGGVIQYAVWGVAGLLGLSLLSLPREKALKRSLVYLLFGVVACYLLFVLKTAWFSPAVPACLLLASGMFVRLFGRKPSNLANE